MNAHMSATAASTIGIADCDTSCIHPPAVLAARAALAEAPPIVDVAGLFVLLSDATRLRLLASLTAGELCV